MEDRVGDILRECVDNSSGCVCCMSKEGECICSKEVIKAKLDLVKWIQGHRRVDDGTVYNQHAKAINSALNTLCDEVLPGWEKKL